MIRIAGVLGRRITCTEVVGGAGPADDDDAQVCQKTKESQDTNRKSKKTPSKFNGETPRTLSKLDKGEPFLHEAA